MSTPTAEHPTRADGVTPYAFGGYAYLKLGCRCAGCLAAQKATSEKANANRNKRAGRATRTLREESPVSSVVSDVLGDVKPTARTVKDGATAKQVEHAMAQVLVYVSIGFVWFAARGLPISDDQTDRLALADDEAATIAAPIARVFAGSDLNSRYGRQLVDNSDVLEAVFTMAFYVKRTTKTLGAIRAEFAPRPTGQASPAPQPTGGPYGPAGPTLAVVPDVPDLRGGEPEEFTPPRPSYAPYEPGSQLASD